MFNVGTFKKLQSLVAKGDKDDFTALKRYVDKVIKKDSLFKTVSVHNLN